MRSYDREYQKENQHVSILKFAYAAAGVGVTMWLQQKKILPEGVGIDILGGVASQLFMNYAVFKPRQAWNNVLRAQNALEAHDLESVKKYGGYAIVGANEKTRLGQRTIARAKEILHSEAYKQLDELI